MYGNSRYKIKCFSVQNTKQHSFCKKKYSLNSRNLNRACVVSQKLNMKLTYISFIGAKKLPFCGDNFRSLLVPVSIFQVFCHRVPSSVSR